MSQENISTIRDGYESFARGDFGSLPFDAQIEWIEPDVEGIWGHGTHRGRDSVIKEIFGPLGEHFDDFRVQCDQFLDVGEQVIVTGRFLGRGKETGNELNAPFAHFWTLRGGKVTKFQNYTDTANWLQALHHLHIEEPAGGR